MLRLQTARKRTASWSKLASSAGSLLLVTLLLLSMVVPWAPRAFATDWLSDPLEGTTMSGWGIPTDPLVVTTCEQLMEIDHITRSGTNSLQYVLGNDIDCSGVSNFVPIGFESSFGTFSGTFDGRGHTISNVTTNYGNGERTGILFRDLNQGSVLNVHLENMTHSSTASGSIGALAGSIDGSTVANVTVSSNMQVPCSDYDVGPTLGGLAAVASNSSTIANVTAVSTIVISEPSVGAGCNYYQTIVGGLLGQASETVIQNSSADIDLAFDDSATSGCSSYCRLAGGLIGLKNGGTVDIERSYATGSVTIDDTTSNRAYNIGGLVGVAGWGYGGALNIQSSFSDLTTVIPACTESCSLPQFTGGIIGNKGWAGTPSIDSTTSFDAQAIQATNDSCIGDVANADCTAVNTISSPAPNYFKNNHTNPPLSSWDFTGLWQTAVGLPVLRTLAQPNPGVATNAVSAIMSTTQVELSWTPPVHVDELGADAEPSDYYVSYKKASGGSWILGSTLSAATMGSLEDFYADDLIGPLQVKRLEPNTDYIFAISAQNSSGYWSDPVLIQGKTATPGLHLISDCQGLQDIEDGLDENYELAKDIDCSDTINWNDGLGFQPIGVLGNTFIPFTGVFEGNGHAIHDLYIGGTTANYAVGLFGLASGALIQDVTLDSATFRQNVFPLAYMGGLVAYGFDISVHNAHVEHLDAVGPWVYAGGLTGVLTVDIAANRVEITKSSATGSIAVAFATDPTEILVDPEIYAGGLAAAGLGVDIDNSYASIDFSSPEIAFTYGGLIGQLGGDGTDDVRHSYASGQVEPSVQDGVAGGLAGSIAIGSSDSATKISDSFSALTTNVDSSMAGGIASAVSWYGGTPYDGYNLAFSNIYHDADNVGTPNCDMSSIITSCHPIAGQPNYFKNNTTNAPLNTWDFGNIWQTTSEYPIFKQSLIDSVTPIPAERINRNQTPAPGRGGASAALPPSAGGSINIPGGLAAVGLLVPDSSSQSSPILEALKKFINNLPEGVVQSFPYVLLSLLMIGVLAMLIEIGRQTRRLHQLNLLIAKQRSIAEQRDTFWHLAANYLRAPVTLLMGGADLLALSKAKNKAASRDKITNLVTGLQGKVEGIMKQIEESHTLQDIAWPKAHAGQKAYRSPSFWLPLFSVAGLLLLANYIIRGFRHLDVSMLNTLTQLMIFAIGAIALYWVVGSLGGVKDKRRRAEELLARQEAALDKARTKLITDTADTLDQDVDQLEKTLADLSSKEDSAPILHEGARRLRQIVDSFQLLINAQNHSLMSLSAVSASARLQKSLDQVVADLQPQIISRNLTIQLPKDLSVRLHGSQKLLKQVLSSVLSNAVDFSPQGGTVTVEAGHDGGMSRLTITDQGVGVSKEQRGNMFEPFTKADGQDALQMDHGGLGINLYLDREIMQYLGGSIEVDSHEGSGTSVHITWPEAERVTSSQVPNQVVVSG